MGDGFLFGEGVGVHMLGGVVAADGDVGAVGCYYGGGVGS